MKLGLKDILFARGRFALMAAVVALIAMLLVMLTSLTAGLAHQSTSAVKSLSAGRVVFSLADADKASFTASTITSEQLASYRDALGEEVYPLGVSSARARGTSDGERDGNLGAANVALFAGESLPGQAEPGSGEIWIDRDTASDLGLLSDAQELIDTAAVSINGQLFPHVTLMDAAWYSHQPVARIALADWRTVAHIADDTAGTVLLLAPGTVAGLGDNALAQLEADTNTSAVTVSQSLRALSSYSSENGSLMLMQAFLYGISGLVIAAFVAVWTVQRTRDIAVLKALGASTGYVIRDSLTQALVITVLGSVVGGALGAGLAGLVSNVVPINLTAWTGILPVVGITVIGVAASLVAVRQTLKINPLLALGGN